MVTKYWAVPEIQVLYETNGGKCVMDSAFCARGNDFVWQAAEWGMRALQGSFPRLKCRMVYEERGERQLILESIVLLYNWRANTVGINQIRTTFMPYLDKDCDQIVNDYLQ